MPKLGGDVALVDKFFTWDRKPNDRVACPEDVGLRKDCDRVMPDGCGIEVFLGASAGSIT
jgi:hypothetical protein